MGYWVFMLVCCLLIPAIMLSVGISFSKKPPKKINNLYGYRTSRSMKNAETWEFANRYMGVLWRKIALALFTVSIIPMLFVIVGGEDLIGTVAGAVCLVQLVSIFATIGIVESALKKNFDTDGNRR